MGIPAPPPPPRRLGLDKAVALVGAAAIAVLVLFFAVIAATQFRQADFAAESRARLVPSILENHRMALNLHRMLAAGDLVVGSMSADKRREAMLNARAIAGHPAFMNNESVRALMAEASQVIRDIAGQLNARDAVPESDFAARHALERDAAKRWLAVRAKLEALADKLVVDAAGLTIDRFDTLARGSRMAALVTLGGLATTTALVIGLLLATRRWVVRPLVQAVGALRQVYPLQPEAPMAGLPRMAEFAMLHQDIGAVRQLVAALTEAREELERSNRDLEQFAYVASHDLREPLRMVTGFLGLIVRRYDHVLDEDGRAFIAFATEGATRMDQLIQDLLAYSRIGRQGDPHVTRPLAETVRLAVDDVAAAIAETGGVVEVAPDLPAVHGDHEQLERLFQNLLGNALKYRAAGRPPHIRVSAARGNDHWRIAVADNGIGIESDHFERIFLLFQRLHTRDRYPGTGLGLAICKKIAEYHGGALEVDSVFGRGTTFTLVLPA